MSTGLTWVVCYDTDQGTQPVGSWVMTFNDYSEALKFAIYEAKSVRLFTGADYKVVFSIYTTSPNPIGYVDSVDDPEFTAYE